MSKNETFKNLKINKLKLVLMDLGISQTEFAERIGRSRNTISRICNNTSQPSLEFLWEISLELGVDIKDLLYSSISIGRDFE